MAGRKPSAADIGTRWCCSGSGAELTFGHNGGNEGYVAQICLRPADGSGLVFLANADEAYPVLRELMDLNRFSRSL